MICDRCKLYMSEKNHHPTIILVSSSTETKTLCLDCYADLLLWFKKSTKMIKSCINCKRYELCFNAVNGDYRLMDDICSKYEAKEK